MEAVNQFVSVNKILHKKYLPSKTKQQPVSLFKVRRQTATPSVEQTEPELDPAIEEFCKQYMQQFTKSDQNKTETVISAPTTQERSFTCLQSVRKSAVFANTSRAQLEKLHDRMRSTQTPQSGSYNIRWP